MFETVTATVEDRIGRLTLNRPAKLNPLSVQTLAEVEQAARFFDSDRNVRVVIVSGAGRAFSAGADLDSFHSVPDGGLARDGADQGFRAAEALEAMRAIAIAQIDGWCVGGGVVLAAACDLRVASESARFAIPEVDLGIGLAWGGIPRLVREVGPALCKELVLTCRPFDAAEALQAGFLNRVVPTDELAPTVEELARVVASKAQVAVESVKAHTNAVTRDMVGLSRSWADADSLRSALHDPEAAELRKQYLAARSRMNKA